MKKLSHQFDFDLLSVHDFVLKIFRPGLSRHGPTENYECFLILMWDHLIVACPKLIDPCQDKNLIDENRRIQNLANLLRIFLNYIWIWPKNSVQTDAIKPPATQFKVWPGEQTSF